MYQINPKAQSLYISFVIFCLNHLLKSSICALIVALILVIIWLYNYRLTRLPGFPGGAFVTAFAAAFTAVSAAAFAASSIASLYAATRAFKAFFGNTICGVKAACTHLT